MSRKQLLLRHGQFFDLDTGLRLKAGRPVPHPAAIGKMTREWIAAGGIEVIDLTPPPPPKPKPMVEEVPLEDRVQAITEKYTLAELRAKLRDHEIKFSWNAKEANLAEKLIEAGLE